MEHRFVLALGPFRKYIIIRNLILCSRVFTCSSKALSGVTETLSLKWCCDVIEMEQSSSLDSSSLLVVPREAERHSIDGLRLLFLCLVGTGILRSQVKLVLDASAW